MAVQVYIEGQRLELFDTENISIRQSVQDVRDISKLFADFSKSFTVPASKTNNKIFEHYYNADIDDGFDARTRKQATIDIDTLDFKRGKIRLDDVVIENGVAKHYRVTFFGDVIKIKDLLGDDKLNSLSWLDNFDHTFSDTNVKTGLTSGLDFTVDSVLYEDAVVYPLVSYKRQWMVNSDSSDTTSTDTLVNIDYDAARTDGVDYRNLKPFIKADVVKKAIEEKYSISFTGAFFSSQIWQQMYVNLQNKTTSLSAGLLIYETSESGTLDWSAGQPVELIRFKYRGCLTPASGFSSVNYKLRFKNNDTIVYETPNFVTGTACYEVDVNIDPEGFLTETYDYDFSAEIITEASFDFDVTQTLEYRYFYAFGSTSFTGLSNNVYTSQSIVLEARIVDLVQDIKTYDFLTSMFKTFNSVVTPDGEDLELNDLQTWYTEGQVYDVTKYIQTDKVKVERGKIYSQIDFKFKESKQILAEEFKNNNNRVYGNLEQRLFDASGDVLDGGKLSIETIFENPVFERLTDQNTSNLTPIQYCPFINKDLEAYTGSPFLTYCPLVNVSTSTIGFVNSVGYEELSASVRMPSHSLIINQDSFNLNFNAEVNEYTYAVFLETIYKTYYNDYIGDIFSIKRRIYNFTGMLSNTLLNKLKLNDRLVIKDRRYIINSITSRLTNRNASSDSLELINDIYDAPLASDQLNTSVFNPSSGTYNSSAATYSTTYTGTTGLSIDKVSDGFGVSWFTTITTTTSGAVTECSFSLTENTSGATRTGFLQVVDGINDPLFKIIQESGSASALNFSNSDNTVLMQTILTGKN